MSKEVADLDYFEMDLYEYKHRQCPWCGRGFNKRSKIVRLINPNNTIDLLHERCVRGWKDLRYLFE